MRITLVATLFAFLVGMVPPVFAVENSGVGGKPANPRNDNPRSQSIFVYELEPGKTVQDAVTLINGTDQPKTVEVYPADGQIASGGAFACDQKADKRDQEAAWITLDKESVELPPASEQKVDFTLTVPKDASVGEHNACIAIQAVEAPAASGVNGVQLSFRSAIRVAVTVPGKLSKELVYDSLNVKRQDHKLLANVAVRNNGNVSLDTTLDTKVSNLLGMKVETISGEYPVLAHQRAEFNFEFKKPVWGGVYRVVSTATYNDDQGSSLGEKSDNRKTIRSSKTVFVVPNASALAADVGFVVLVALLVWRWQRAKVLHRKGKSYTVKDGDNLQSIARVLGVRWKLIARMNGIKAPYVLKPGETIRLPQKAIKKLAAKKSAKSTTKKSTKE